MSAIDTVEAIYRLELEEAAWLEGIVEAAAPLIDDGLGVGAYTATHSPGQPVAIHSFIQLPNNQDFDAYVKDKIINAPMPVAEQVYRIPIGAGSASEVGGREPLKAWLEGNPWGVVDTVGIQGMNPSGQCAYIVAGTREFVSMHPKRREKLSRVGAHLAAAYRLRLRLKNVEDVSLLDSAEAVLDPSGKAISATGRATSSNARDVLKAAVGQICKAQQRRSFEDVDEAIDLWQALCEGRWTLVDTIDTDGHRYFVAHKNSPAVQANSLLSRREAQVLTYAGFGHSDKMISYELGLSSGTVKTLLSRAMKKMRIRDRLDVIRLVMGQHHKGDTHNLTTIESRW